MIEKELLEAIFDFDGFLDMPLDAQALYAHLALRSDDDGIVLNPKGIARMVNAPEELLDTLARQGFIEKRENYVVVSFLCEEET